MGATPFQTKAGSLLKEGKGTPQGGVISPLLASLFLNHKLHKLIGRTLTGVTFVRYADDVIVHCISEAQNQ